MGLVLPQECLKIWLGLKKKLTLEFGHLGEFGAEALNS
jgi:hypothetical protein